MFGYIVTDREQLDQTERQQYRGYYCGLCQTLHRRHGRWGQAALNFDMTFLYLLLASLYEPKEQTEQHRCPVHPFRKQTQILSKVADYCADMTVLLAYYNALDDWNDDRNHVKHLYARRLEASAAEVAAAYPRQSQAVIENIEKINQLEREQEINLDAVANCFGKMMGEIFVLTEDNWSPKLRALGENLGKFIYFMDAWEDGEKDLKHKNYNPLLQLKDDPDYAQKCTDILTLFLSEAVLAFETLPIVDNAHILRNILYAGVWSKFISKEKKDDR